MKQLIMITIKKIILTTILFPKMTSITIQIYIKILICKNIYNYFLYRQYEKIVIEDVLESSGISVKPTAKQLNEFAKKIKSLNHQLILKNLFERMNKSVIENDFKMLAKLLYVIQSIIQDSSNTNYINFLKQQSRLFENIFNKNINKIINTISSEIYKCLTNTNLMKEEDFLNENNMRNNMPRIGAGNNNQNNSRQNNDII